jgi:glycosyltransferase involved in cell wall biosynthesis
MEGQIPTKRIIVLPVFNEEAALEREFEKLQDKAGLVIMVDDGSTDKTGEIAEKISDKCQSVRLIRLDRNMGKSHALSVAFGEILKMKSRGEVGGEDLVISTDADGQLPPEAIDEAVLYFYAEKMELLIGMRDFAKYPFIKRLGNRILSFIAAVLTGFPFRDTQCGFRIFTVDALERMLPYYRARGYACEQEISIIGAMIGLKMDNSFSIKPVYYRSNSTFYDAFQIAADSLATYVRVRLGHKNTGGGGGNE